MHELLISITNSAKQTMQAQAINAHNLANAGTEGFKSEIAYYSALDPEGNMSSSPDLTPGVVRATGRDLDVSINGEGWMAVMGQDGTEAYSRRGDLHVDAFGQLTNGAGQAIMGNNCANITGTPPPTTTASSTTVGGSLPGVITTVPARAAPPPPAAPGTP